MVSRRGQLALTAAPPLGVRVGYNALAGSAGGRVDSDWYLIKSVAARTEPRSRAYIHAVRLECVQRQAVSGGGETRIKGQAWIRLFKIRGGNVTLSRGAWA